MVDLQLFCKRYCSFVFAAMGVAELLAWGAPPVLVLLHLHLIHMTSLESEMVLFSDV